MTYPPKIRLVEDVRADIAIVEGEIDRASHNITSTEKGLNLLATEQLPKSPSLDRMIEISDQYRARKETLQAERQSAIDNLATAQQSLEKLREELSRSETEEARLVALDAAWNRSDSIVRDYAKALLEIHSLNPNSGVSARRIFYRQSGFQPIGVTSIQQLVDFPAHREKFFAGDVA